MKIWASVKNLLLDIHQFPKNQITYQHWLLWKNDIGSVRLFWDRTDLVTQPGKTHKIITVISQACHHIRWWLV